MIFFQRFLLVGFSNTLFAYLVFVLFIQLLNYNIAYTISFAMTIILSYFLNSLYVFKEKLSVRKFFQFPLVYLIQYLFGVVLLNILNVYFHTSNYINMLIVTILSIPLTFFFSKRIIYTKKQ